MIEIDSISYSDVRDYPELIAEYAAECSIPALGEINPQWDTYALLEESGLMRTFAAFMRRDYLGDAPKLIGFATVLTSVNPHYGVKIATVESLFVAKGYRSSGAGIRLMDTIERHAKGVGCKAILYSAPTDGKLEAVLGNYCVRTNSVFCKPLI